LAAVFTFARIERLYSDQLRQSHGSCFRKGFSGMSSKNEKM